MADKKNVPMIRFSGFDYEWDKKQFDAVFDMISNNTLSRDNLNYVGGSTQNVHYGDILTVFGEYVDVNDIKLPFLNDEELAEKFHNSTLKDGDIVIADTAEDDVVGKCIEIGNIGERKIVAGLHTIPCRPKEKFASKYMGYYLNSDAYHHKLLPLMQGVKVIAISKTGIRGTELVLTNDYQEQEKIGVFLSLLDEKIKQTEEKISKIKLLKQSMLIKIFPKEGEKVPQIRFKGFRGDWEHRKITEVGTVFIGLVTTMTKHYTSEGHLLIRNSDIKDGYFEFDDAPIYLDKEFAEENASRMHQVGDVVTVHTGDVGTSAVITEKEVNSIGFATIVTRPNQRIIDSNYLATFLNTEQHKKWAVSISTGDGRTNYNLGDYVELIVPVPPLAEQIKIAEYIGNLNEMIDLCQQELQKLKNTKSACMKRMFV